MGWGGVDRAEQFCRTLGDGVEGGPREVGVCMGADVVNELMQKEVGDKTLAMGILDVLGAGWAGRSDEGSMPPWAATSIAAVASVGATG